ncbi:hypothetical protein FACS1894159_09870 [Bacteroidia bacterium]|nr:hypothetical protein FACS1894159_09870 [Bacteroidia bacterium]
MKMRITDSNLYCKLNELAINAIAGAVLMPNSVRWILLPVLLCFFCYGYLLRMRQSRRKCRYCSRQTIHRQLADNRLELLRHIIELSYVHKPRKNLFYDKVCEMVHISELKRRNIIDFDAAKTSSCDLPLRGKDLEFFCLLQEGFTQRELSVVYDMSNPHSIYVKKHRIMSKLKNTYGNRNTESVECGHGGRSGNRGAAENRDDPDDATGANDGSGTATT